MGLIESSFNLLKTILTKFNPIELNSTEIRQSGVYIVFEGSINTDKAFEREYIFGIYLSVNSLMKKTDFESLDEIEKILRDKLVESPYIAYTKCNILQVDNKNIIYRFEVRFKK